MFRIILAGYNTDNKWAQGQAVAYLRTPMLYSTTSMLSGSGVRSVVVGTTNRDEGSYLGYVGKAADGMVDIQLIADLHKSEVRALAIECGVPVDNVQAQPTGDMFDGRTDADIMGADYDGAELFWRMREERTTAHADWNTDDKNVFAEISEHLENLHQYNSHKYLSPPQGVFFDVLPRCIPGGWS